MNNIKDFHKRDDGVVINTNTHDYKRARRRNHISREQEKIFGNGKNKIDDIEQRLKRQENEMKKIENILSKILKKLENE